MEAKREIGIAGVLLGLVAALCLALCLAPGLAIAEDTSFGAAGSELQTAANKPSQAIQAAYMHSFITDTGKNLNAKVVEGNGALSYAVKSGGDCVSVDSNGALTFKKAGEAIITVTAAATNEYAETSIDVPITIYDHFDYTFTVGNTLDCVDYYGHYPINKLEIKLKGWENVLGSGTINSPQRGSKTTIRATGFAKRIELKAEIQYRKNTRSASETLDLNGGGRFEIEVTSRGTIVMCDYGITLPEPDYVAPVAKPNLSSTGQNQLLIYPGSVLSGGQHMEYTFGTATEPNQNGWTDNYGFMRAKDPGDYYVWWKTASRDRRSLMYFSGGRLDTAPQCMKVTIGKGNINPTVSIDGWTYGEEPKAPTVTGNTGNGEVTYEYKAKNAGDNTYSATVPTDAGDYTVRATIAESKTHSGGSATADFTIAKATVPNQDVRIAGYVRSVDSPSVHWEANIEQSLAGMMPDNARPTTYTAGTPTYKVNGAEQNWPAGFTFAPAVNSKTGDFSANLQITSEAADAIQSIDQVGEIVLPVTVASQNYNDATINVVVMPTARSEKTVTIEGVPDSKTKTFGDDPFTLTATVDDEGAKAGDWYWYSSDPSVLEVPAITDPNTGSNTVTVTVKNPGSAQIMAWYEPSGGTTIGAALTESITVNKASISPSVSIGGWTYGGTANAPALAEGLNPGNGAVTYSYSGTASDGRAYGPSAEAPTKAGEYTITATVAETANYKGATCAADFTITKKPVTATVTAVDKTYDGTTDATVSATVNKDDLVQSDLDDAALVEDDKVAVSGLSGSFADKNAGTGKTVSLNYDNVVSPVANAECYEVTGEMPKASITPLAINVGTADKSSPYGEPLAELAYGPYGPTTLVEGDTLASLGVTASTKASETSAVGEYPITLSGGTGNPNYEVTLGEDAVYTITAADISKATVELAQTSFTYDGKAKEPAVKVTLGERELVAGTDYDVSYKDNTDAGTATVTVTGKGNYAGVATATFTIVKKGEPQPQPQPQPTNPVALTGSGHVQTYGDVAAKASGKGIVIGTTGEAKRLEQFTVSLPKDTNGGIEYRAHLQGKGWGDWVEGGKPCGTTNEARRMEAVQMRLAGKLSDTHSVWYRAHSQTLGWLGWARDGQAAGTAGQSKRVEAVEVQVLPKGQRPEGHEEGQASYVGAATGRAHVQGVGWASPKNPLELGTTGKGRRLEAIRLSVPNQPADGGISYEVHAQGIGWMPAAADGALAGTTGQAKRLEAVRISLTGDAAKDGGYSVWYRVHSQSYGWLGWAHDGQDAGTSGLAKRAEAIDVQVLPQGQVPRGYDASKAACVNG